MPSRQRTGQPAPASDAPAVAPAPAATDQDLVGNSYLQGILGSGGDCDYTVVPGDTLWDISRRTAGQGSSWPDLYERNRSVVGEDPNRIFPGQHLDVCEAPAPAAPRLGLSAYDVVPDDFVGPLAPNQIRQSQHDHLSAFDFQGLNVVGDDFVGPLAPGQMRQGEYAELQSAWLNIADGRGMNISGSEADAEAFRHMLRDGIGSSSTFRELITSIGNDTDAAHLVQANVGRSQPGVIGDAFATNDIDLDDLDAFRSLPDHAHRDAFTREDAIGHFLSERQSALASTDPSDFDPAHQHGIDVQNQIRAERGAQAITSNTGSRRADGNIDASFNLADGRAHTMVIDANGNIVSQVEPP